MEKCFAQSRSLPHLRHGSIAVAVVADFTVDMALQCRKHLCLYFSKSSTDYRLSILQKISISKPIAHISN